MPSTGVLVSLEIAVKERPGTALKLGNRHRCCPRVAARTFFSAGELVSQDGGCEDRTHTWWLDTPAP